MSSRRSSCGRQLVFARRERQMKVAMWEGWRRVVGGGSAPWLSCLQMICGSSRQRTYLVRSSEWTLSLCRQILSHSHSLTDCCSLRCLMLEKWTDTSGGCATLSLFTSPVWVAVTTFLLLYPHRTKWCDLDVILSNLKMWIYSPKRTSFHARVHHSCCHLFHYLIIRCNLISYLLSAFFTSPSVMTIIFSL